MLDVKMASQPAAAAARPAPLVMRWVPVTNQQGSARMQAMWVDAVAASPAATAYPAANPAA